MDSISPRVTIFAPDPLLSLTIERRGDGDDDIHLHPAGQGVWIARMAGEFGAWPILCGLTGGETGRVLTALLEGVPGEHRLVEMRGSTGSYVTDRRGGERRLLAGQFRPAPERHELDDLVETTCAAALSSQVLVMANPFPDDGLPLAVLESVAATTCAAHIPLLVDLSSPRLDCVLPFAPDLVKLNDWELAEYIKGPVDGRRALEAARRLQTEGAQAVAVTRAEKPILVVPADGDPFEVVPPAFPVGFREGCGDTMMGALAAMWAQGAGLKQALVVGAAAGAANFLRHGLGTGGRGAVEELAAHVAVRPLLKTAA